MNEPSIWEGVVIAILCSIPVWAIAACYVAGLVMAKAEEST